MGCHVVAEAETGSQTINLFRTVRPQLVALDLGIRPSGDVDALAVFRAIRSEAPEVSVLVISGSSDAEKVRIFLKEGALDCIVEPFDSVGLEHMWRTLSRQFAELRRLEVPNDAQVARGARGHRC
jgi:DNA-binding response OmpR family regulator